MSWIIIITMTIQLQGNISMDYFDGNDTRYVPDEHWYWYDYYG